MGTSRNPPIDVPAVDQAGRFVPDWYDRLLYLNGLDPIPPVAANVSSIDTATGAITLGYGLARTLQALRTSLTLISNILVADIALNNTAAYFDGPSVAQGTTGTWVVFGTVTVLDAVNAPATFNCRLWDGTTPIASTVFRTPSAVGGYGVTLCGVIAAPTGNLRISCQAASFNTGKILFNASGNARDSAIFAVRIA